MSISDQLALPAQPTSGQSIFLPYGGDGLTAPQAAWVVKTYAVTGDATGGNVTMQIQLDRRYCSLIAYVQCSAGTIGADTQFRLSIDSASEPSMSVQGKMPTLSQYTTDCSALWCPPGVVLPGERLSTISYAVDNVDGKTYTLNALIYLFGIQVRTKYPLPPLLASTTGPFISPTA